MNMFRKAHKSMAKAKICLAGPAGSGKTYSSLLIASGLGKRIAMLDTEQGSGDLYSDLLNYDITTITPPFTCDKYIEVIKEAEKERYDVLIIDSLTHAWAGEGGLLHQQGKIVDSGKYNSYTAWRMITPKHNQLVDTILQSKIHVIATARSKMEYSPETEDGKIKRINKIGMAPILREGMEYEFTVVFDISTPEHIASTTKDRTSLFDGKFFKPTQETGTHILNWLNTDSVKEHALDASKEDKKKIITHTQHSTRSGQKTDTPPVQRPFTMINVKQGSLKQQSNTEQKWQEFLSKIKILEKTLSKETYDSIIKNYLPLESIKSNPAKQDELYYKLQDELPF